MPTVEHIGLMTYPTTDGSRQLLYPITQIDAVNGLSDVLDEQEKDLALHKNDKNNPHGVTKSQVGLGNVDNTADVNKNVNYAVSAGKVNNNFTITLNGGTTEGTSKFTFNGSAAKSMNITPANIGAVSSNDVEQFFAYTESAYATKPINFTATIGTNWAGTAAPYTQNINVSGVLTTDKPIVDITPSADFAIAEQQLEAWGNIYRITTGADKITVYATEKTTTNISIQMEVHR